MKNRKGPAVFEDRYGLALSTSSETAAVAYRDGVDLMLSAWSGAEGALDAAIAADPEFALAHAARARMHYMWGDGRAAKAKAATARDLVARNGTARERSHVEVMALSMEDRLAKTLEGALVHLDTWPRDAVIMSLPLGAFGLFAFSGMADHDQARVDLCERHARHYGDDWWFLTYLGWSHIENGNVAAGRRMAERAFEKRRENANALHAVAHGMFEDGSIADAESLIRTWLPIYDRTARLHGHISWHEALLALERGDSAQALAIYAERLQPKVSGAPQIILVTDGASLLWRCVVYGHPVPNEFWHETAANAERAFPTTGVAFADVHIALALAATGNRAALDKRNGELEMRISAGKLAAGSVVPALCRAARAFADGDYPGCIRILEPAAADVVRIGGSHAQREVIEDTLLVALMKTGQTARAQKLLDGRLHRRHSPRDTRWRTSLNPVLA